MLMCLRQTEHESMSCLSRSKATGAEPCQLEVPRPTPSLAHVCTGRCGDLRYFFFYLKEKDTETEADTERSLSRWFSVQICEKAKARPG